MKHMKKLLAMTLSLLLLLGSTLPAMAEEQSYADQIESQLDNAQENITITLTNDVTEDIWFTAKEGLTYTISGKDYTLSNLLIDGEGTIIIDVKAIKATTEYEALWVNGSVRVTVTGDIIGYNAVDTGEGAHANDGISAQVDAVVTVTGDVTGGSAEGNNAYAGDGIYADGNATVTVTGNVTGGSAKGVTYAGGGNGISAMDTATVKVNGNVTGGSTEGEESCYSGRGIDVWDASKVEVTGNVTGGKGITTGDTEDSYVLDGEGIFAVGTMDDEETTDINEETTVTVTVTGNVTGGDTEGYDTEGGNGIHAYLATVKVTGNVTGGQAKTGNAEDHEADGGDGIEAEAATVTVDGNVTGGQAKTGDAEDHEADGGDGIYAYDDSTVTVKGNVTGGKADGYEATGGFGIYADYATVKVVGDVTGGSTKGTDVYVGHGIYTYGVSTVTVEGNVTGGDLTAVADEEEGSDDFDPIWALMDFTLNAGHGVVASMASDITIQGDVTGGNAKGDLGDGGAGLVVAILAPNEEWTPDEGEEPQEMPEPGEVKITGTVTGGQSKNGTAGVGIYYTTADDTVQTYEEIVALDADILFGTLEDYLKENDGEYAAYSYMYVKMLTTGMIPEDDETRQDVMSAMQEAVLRDLAVALKVEVPEDLDTTDTESEEYKTFVEKLEMAAAREIAKELGVTVPENLEELDPESAEYQAFMDKYNTALNEADEDVQMLTADRLLRESGLKHFDAAVANSEVPKLVKDMYKDAVMPTVSVGRASTAYGLAMKSAIGDTLLEMLGGDPAVYNVTVQETENGTVKADKTTAKAGETITLTVTPAEGYVVDTVKAGNTVLKAKDGVYTATMVSGGLDITATFKVKPAVDTDNSDTTKSPATGEAATVLPVLLLAAAAAVLAASTKRRLA